MISFLHVDSSLIAMKRLLKDLKDRKDVQIHYPIHQNQCFLSFTILTYDIFSTMKERQFSLIFIERKKYLTVRFFIVYSFVQFPSLFSLDD